MKILKDHSLILCILLLALGLRLPLLNGSFWLDEAAQALESTRPLSQQLEIVPDFQPPLLHLILHFAAYFSHAEWWLRMIGALIPGLISIWFTYKIGEKFISKKVGVFAALLLATSSFHIFYSQELRPYALPAALGVASWWVLLKVVTPQKVKDFKYGWLAFAALTALGLYASYLYPFLIIGQAAWVVWAKREHVVSFVIAAVMAGLMFVPMLPLFLQQLAAGGQVRVDLPGWEEVVSIPQLKSLPLVVAKFMFGVLDTDVNVWFVGSVVLLGLLSLVGIKHMSQKDLKSLWQDHLWLVLGFLIPLVTSWIISFWIPVVQPKRVLYLLPFWFLFFSWVVVKTKLRTIALGLFGFLLFLNLLSTVQYWFNPQYQRENWRSAYYTIAERYDADKTIAVFAFPEPFAPWRWYDYAQYPTLSTGTLHISQVEDLREHLKPMTHYEFVVVFEYLSDLSDPQRQLLQEIEAYGYVPIDLLEYPNLGFVRIYAKKGVSNA